MKSQSGISGGEGEQPIASAYKPMLGAVWTFGGGKGQYMKWDLDGEVEVSGCLQVLAGR